jgi:hypothetical protein
MQGMEQREENEAEAAEAEAAAATPSAHPPSAPSFTHSRLSCIADIPAVFSDCDSELAAECRSATAEERGMTLAQAA